MAPEKVISLTTVGIPHRAAVRPTPKLGWALRHFVTLALPGAEGRFAADDFAELERLVHRWGPTWKVPAEELALIKDCFRAPGTVHGALGYYRAASVRIPPFMRERVRVPTLCFAGADDPGVGPATYEATRKHFAAGFDVAVVPGGHFCHRESPAEVLRTLVPFLRKHR